VLGDHNIRWNLLYYEIILEFQDGIN